jgi:superfamily I DNA/RNA helicase
MFSETELDNVIPPERVICQDEMVETVGSEEFQKRLWGMFGVTFRCLLTLPQVDRVRWHLFPEIRVSQGTFDLSRPAESGVTVPDIIRVMDLQQEQVARNIGEGHRIIHGVAGSGKTMILGYRARHLAQALAKPVLVLCYNAALAARLEHLVAEQGLGEKVNVRSFHSWCMRQLELYQVSKPEGDGDSFWRAVVEAVIRGVDRGQIPRAQYGAVLIDEGHDFEPEWLKLVAQMVDPETNSLLVLYDDAQSINRSGRRLSFSFSEVGIQARGRTTVLKLNYRNTAEVMACACTFARELLSAKEADEDGIPVLVPETAGRHGEIPELAKLPDAQSELKFIAERARALRARGMPWKDMAVLVRMNHQGQRIADYFTKGQIPASLVGRGTRLRPGDDTVKILTFHSSKGLEFPAVFIPFLESLPHMGDDLAGEAKLLYVGMTRAMDRLLLTHHGDSAFVGRVREAIASSAAT